MKLQVQMFGKLCVRRDEGGCVSINSRKAIELFCYLLLYRDRPHYREILVDTIWNETPTRQSKKYLRQALWHLQSGLVPASKQEKDLILTIDSDWIQINSQADLWVDVIELENAFQLGKDIPSLEFDAHRFEVMKQAVCLYQGDFLEGCYEDWCLYERERLQNMYLSMVDKLMLLCESRHLYDEALAYGGCILRHDLASERTHRRMTRIYYKSGNRTEALRQYQRCEVALKEELGIKPQQKTIALYERIRQDQIPEETTPLAFFHNPSSESVEILNRLDRLRHSLNLFYEQTQAEIHLLENALKSEHHKENQG